MSSISVAGDTSGSITLSAPAVAGSTVLTLPAVSGNVLASNSATTLNSGASAMTLQTNGTTAMTIDASQNVGIGSAPISKFSVYDSTNDAVISLTTAGTLKASYIAIAETIAGYGGIYYTSGGTENWRIAGGHTTNTLSFHTGPSTTERMRIDASGNVLVGSTTSPTGVFGGILCPNQIFLGGRTSFVTGLLSVINMNHNGGGLYGIMMQNISTAASNALTFTNSSLATVGSINTTSSATAYNTTSDYRLKENIAPMTGALNTVAKLKPVTYDWIANKSKSQGFIAHELQEVVPDCVSGEKDAVNEDGSIKAQGIDTSFLVATLTAAIQELKAELDAVKAELAKLQGTTL